MYPISNEAKALFESNAAKVVRITGSTVRILPTDIAVYSGNTLVYQSGNSKHLKLYSGSSEIYDNQGTKTIILYSGDKPIFINDEAGMPIQLNLTSSDVRQGDFSIDRYSCNGQMLEIGTAIASEFTLQLDNVEGQFDGVIFEGVELFVEIGISDPADGDADIIWVPCGYFTCDHQPRRLNTLSITALDRMMRFDKKPTSGTLTLPKTVAQLVAAGCAACNVALGQSLSGLPNANYSVTALPDSQDGFSWRDIIRWCAGLMGTNAWIDWNGELRFSWYNNDTGYVSTTDNRFSSDLYENPIIITGVKFTDTDEANTTYIAGTEDYAIDVSDNGFINADNADALLPNIYLAMNGFAYTPFSASAIAAPYLWPMDRVTFTDKNGKGHVSLLTNVNISVNGSTDIAAVGESAEFYSYGKSSSFTAQQQATLRRLRRVVGTNINDAVESATAQITGALGGYVRFMYDANGVMTEILIMNTPDITTATKVWRWNQGGFGYSSNGYQGPYTTAITQDGAIVATFITSGEMSADRIQGGTLTLGGVNNADGVLRVLDSNGDEIGTWDKDGIDIDKGNISIPYTDATPSGVAYDGNIDIGNNGFTIQSKRSDDTGYNYEVNIGGNQLKLQPIDATGSYYVELNALGGITSFGNSFIIRGFMPNYYTENNKKEFIVYPDQMYFYNSSGSIWFSVNSNGFSTTVSKSRIVNTYQYSNRLLYCYETPSPMFGDIGEGVIGEDGLCYVTIDPIFAQTITTDNYQVFLQKYGDGDCYVMERKPGWFVVAGTPGLAFGWEIKGKQQDYDQLRLERNDEKFTVPTQTYGEDAAKHIDEIRKEREAA